MRTTDHRNQPLDKGDRVVFHGPDGARWEEGEGTVLRIEDELHVVVSWDRGSFETTEGYRLHKTN